MSDSGRKKIIAASLHSTIFSQSFAILWRSSIVVEWKDKRDPHAAAKLIFTDRKVPKERDHPTNDPIRYSLDYAPIRVTTVDNPTNSPVSGSPTLPRLVPCRAQLVEPVSTNRLGSNANVITMASTSFNTSLPPLPSKQNYAADLISTLKQTCRSTGSQFVLLLVDKEGGSKVFGTNLFTGKLGDWFGPELRQEAKELVLHGAGASTTMGGERAGTAGGGGAATEGNFASPSRKPWLNGGVAPGASSRGSNEPSHGHNTLLGGGGGGTGAGRGSAPPPHASLVDDATRPAVASGQPFNHRNFAAQSPPPRLTRSTSNTFLLEQQSFVPPSSFDQPSALPYPAVSSTVANPPLDLGSHSSSHNPNSNQFRFAPSSRPTTATGTSETTATIRERRKRQPISIQVEEWYSEAFEAKLLLKACKEVYLLWDRVIRDWEANQGTLKQDEDEGNDENEEGGGLLKQPGWWPDTVKFRADGHIGSKKGELFLRFSFLPVLLVLVSALTSFPLWIGFKRTNEFAHRNVTFWDSDRRTGKGDESSKGWIDFSENFNLGRDLPDCQSRAGTLPQSTSFPFLSCSSFLCLWS